MTEKNSCKSRETRTLRDLDSFCLRDLDLRTATDPRGGGSTLTSWSCSGGSRTPY